MNCKLATLQEYSDPMHAVHGYSDSSDDDRAKRTINLARRKSYVFSFSRSMELIKGYGFHIRHM